MSASNYLIPLTNEPQEFEIALAGVVYTLLVRWNDQADAGWVMDISSSNNVPIVCGIPLVTGADLLSGLAYLGIGGSLFVYSSGTDPTAIPTLDSLGVDCNLYFQTSAVQ